ncbi:MAG: MFS transporter [Candidatus Paceibacterota bacterium]
MFKSINKVIRTMIFSDLALLFGWGLVTPILAIFIVQNIKGGDAQVAGIAVGIYWLVKSILQVPLANWLDKIEGEIDDYYALISGTLLASLVPLGFIFASLPWHMYALQGVHSLGMALAIPSWAAIFTRHIEDGKEALSWSLDSSALGVGTGVAGIIGGSLVEVVGFNSLFVGVSVLGLIATLILLLIRKDIIPKKHVFPMPKP